MRFAIVTHAVHFPKGDAIYAYGPYVREMNMWNNYVDEIVVVAPVSKEELSKIHLPYSHKKIRVLRIPAISFVSVLQIVRSLFLLPVIWVQLFRAMWMSDHIHLRCPGNIGLLGCWMQVFFPGKPKTAKYAGNWDPKAEQPYSYRLQKKLLSSTFWSRKMHVLVYGQWPDQSKNIVPFFTATYPRSKSQETVEVSWEEPLRLLFVGSLSPGKRPLHAVKLAEGLHEAGIPCHLDVFGDGAERATLEKYVHDKDLGGVVTLHGNQTSEVVEKKYRSAHFLVLPSKSEGWPKVVAEAMFWGLIPCVTKISCVPWMLGEGERGLFLTLEVEKDVVAIRELWENKVALKSRSKKAMEWSHQYTLDDFSAEIKKLLACE